MNKIARATPSLATTFQPISGHLTSRANKSYPLAPGAYRQLSYTPSRRIAPGIHLPYSCYVPIQVDAQKAYRDHGAWGMLTSIDVNGCDPGTIRSKMLLQKYIDDLIILIDMKAHGPTQIIHFGDNDEVEGYSVSQMIETSMISGHAANKTNALYLDIFSCKPYDPKAAAEFTCNFFEGKSFGYNVLLRGATRK